MCNSKINCIGMALVCALVATPGFAKQGKEKFRDGSCLVERKWKKDGRYEEKRKCSPMPCAEAGPEPTVVITLPPVVILPAGH